MYYCYTKGSRVYFYNPLCTLKFAHLANSLTYFIKYALLGTCYFSIKWKSLQAIQFSETSSFTMRMFHLIFFNLREQVVSYTTMESDW